MYVGPSMTSQSAVGFELRFPRPFVAPACAPGCLISLAGGAASFDALGQGYRSPGAFYASPDGTTYFGTLYVRAPASNRNTSIRLSVSFPIILQKLIVPKKRAHISCPVKYHGEL